MRIRGGGRSLRMRSSAVIFSFFVRGGDGVSSSVGAVACLLYNERITFDMST